MLRSAVNATLESLEPMIERAQFDEAFERAWVDCRAAVHMRHVYDHFDAVLLGATTGVVDYNHRTRDCPSECSAQASSKRLRHIKGRLAHLTLDETPLTIISETHIALTEVAEFKSNLNRECLYLINHTVHHAAQIKVLMAQAGYALDDALGLAPSTASYQRSLSKQD